MQSGHIGISDTHLAAYLLVKGFQIAGVESRGSRREFIFLNVSPAAISSFYGGDDAVSARALLDALRNVRGLLAQELA